jgi:hypothetical protein
MLSRSKRLGSDAEQSSSSVNISTTRSESSLTNPALRASP